MKIALYIILLLVSTSCDKDKQVEKCDKNTSAENGKFGACVFDTKTNNNTVDFTDTSFVINQDTEFSPFVKKIQSNGVLLVGMEKVSDDFIQNVAKTLQQIFPQDSNLNLTKQHAVLNTMLQYSTAIPIFYGDDEDQDVSKLETNCSMCDIIMYNVDGQVMEVIEHLLHHITDVGLFYEYPEQWAFNTTSSEVYIVMQQAIEKDLYKVGNYKELYDEYGCAVYNRVLVQEFSYWLISTYWNLQEPYGPNEDEWTIRNKQQLKEQLPAGYNLVESTVDKVMKAPSKEILEKLNTYKTSN